MTAAILIHEHTAIGKSVIKRYPDNMGWCVYVGEWVGEVYVKCVGECMVRGLGER